MDLKRELETILSSVAAADRPVTLYASVPRVGQEQRAAIEEATRVELQRQARALQAAAESHLFNVVVLPIAKAAIEVDDRDTRTRRILQILSEWLPGLHEQLEADKPVSVVDPRDRAAMVDPDVQRNAGATP